jgi:hypothetical protein
MPLFDQNLTQIHVVNFQLMNHLKVLKKSHAIKKNNSKMCKFPSPTPIKFFEKSILVYKAKFRGIFVTQTTNCKSHDSEVCK